MLNLIVAPKAHNSKGENITKKIVKFLKTENIEYSVYFSSELKDIGASIKELTSLGETEFIVVGDDVIINEFINNIKDFNKIKLGIIPTDKNDDFCRYLELEHRPILAIKNILNKKTKDVDLLLVNDIKAINNIVVGANVESEELYQQYAWKSFITKKYAENRTFSKYEGIELTIGNKSKNKTERICQLVIANGGFSKGKKLSPLSNLSDGLANLVYTNTSDEKIKSIKAFNKGNHIYNNNTKQLWLTNIKITSPNNKIKTIIDGKILNLDKLEVSVIENALKIYI